MSWTFGFAAPPVGDADQARAMLGSKGANLVIMTTELALPVPPGFVISTDACKAFLETGWPDGLDPELRAQMQHIEHEVGRGFGDPSDPLLVSVRSGAPVSMPGMLDTILNLGLSDETTGGLALATGDPAFATACQQRLQTMYVATVGRDAVPDDPWLQLREAIEAVFRSWNSDRARSYRETEGIAADLGTAVVVQAMVFGNRGDDSATGVLFTRNPATGEDTLYGDVLFGAQGEDVVAGTHATQPIAALADRLPDVAAELDGYARALERHFADVCDIEFTIENGQLWLLQNRIGKRSAQAALRIAIEMAEDETFPLSREEAVRRVADILADPPMTVAPDHAGDMPIVAVGLPASPGFAVGAIATSPEAAVKMAEEGRSVILVRAETSPDDVHGMARSAGVLTSTGGLASHAAVVARGWDIPAVVGAREVVVEQGRISIGARMWRQGDEISIDGSTGDVYGEAIATEARVAPEARKLLLWAREFDIAIAAPVDPGPDVPAEGVADRDAAGATAEPVLRLLSIKGFVTPESLAPALGAGDALAQEALAQLVTDGLARESGGMFSLTEDGKAVGADLLAADREAWGADAAAAALDGFLALDARMNATVTAWQMKPIDGEQTLNDHADAAYDAAVLADLAGLHAEVSTWIRPLVAQLPRLAEYARRLEAAAVAVAGGDVRYMASPRVDSYHSIWFELHEDLIRLAGRTREEEVAAGRA